MSISSIYVIKRHFSSGSLKSISRNPRLFYVSSTTSTTSDTTWCHHLKRFLNVDSFQKGVTLHRQPGLARGSVAIWWQMIREGDNSCFNFLKKNPLKCTKQDFIQICGCPFLVMLTERFVELTGTHSQL